MLDINRPLRKAYMALLDGNLSYNTVNVPVYNQFEQIGTNDDYYVLFTQQNNTDVSTKQSFDNSSSVQLTITTKQQLNNSGEAADLIGAQIKQLIYPSRNEFPLNVEGFQVHNTRMVNDFTRQGFDDGTYKVIQRILVFEHELYQTS